MEKYWLSNELRKPGIHSPETVLNSSKTCSKTVRANFLVIKISGFMIWFSDTFLPGLDSALLENMILSIKISWKIWYSAPTFPGKYDTRHQNFQAHDTGIFRSAKSARPNDTGIFRSAMHTKVLDRMIPVSFGRRCTHRCSTEWYRYLSVGDAQTCFGSCSQDGWEDDPPHHASDRVPKTVVAKTILHLNF